ncbi:MAG: GtrA family protein [Treponema sp.]|nr:GtrA family protein [Treponema sp.]
MFRKLKESNHILIQFIKFSLVGLSNTLISYIIYVLLVFLGVHYIIANIIAFIIGVANSFFWNHRFVFKDETGGKRSLIKSLIKTYISYTFTGVIVANFLLYILIDLFGISEYIAPLFCLIVTVPLNYILNKMWAFRQVKVLKEKIYEKN